MERETILSGLNPQQLRAAEALEGAYLVVAGAGSGKTTVLSRRVAALIAQGVEPATILLLTFTRAAAKNMLERARRLSPEAIDVTGGTFHSIAHRLVLENHAMFRLPERPTILDPEDTVSAFRKIVASLSSKDENLPKAGSIAKVHSFAVNTRQPVEDVVWDKIPQFGYAADFVRKCADDYKAFKRSRGLLDYDDLLVAWDAMMDHPSAGQAVRDRFRYVLVDEHQDSNAIQCSIIEKLGGNRPNVMAVGDPAQSIYGFRGSAPRTMFAFVERWPEAQVINLDTNYRSGPDILAVANAVDRSMRERFERELGPAPGAFGHRPRFVSVPGLEDEASFIADEILRQKADGVGLEEQAVLVRSMSAARHVEAELVRRRIPYKVSGGIRISEAAHIKDMLCLARTAVNVLDEPAWMRVLTMARGVGDKKAAAVYGRISEARAFDGLVDPSDLVLDMCRKSPDIADVVEAYRVLAAGGPPVEAVERAMAILDDVLSRRYDDWKARKADVAAVNGLAEGHATLDSFLSSVTLDYSVDRKADVLGVDDEERPLTVSTVHSAKGLEWDTVYIPSFVDGHMPSLYGREPDEMEEEKRVLYVAVTRPKRSLVVVKPAVARQGMLAAASPFESVVTGFMDRERLGAARRPASLSFEVRADIDIFG